MLWPTLLTLLLWCTQVVRSGPLETNDILKDLKSIYQRDNLDKMKYVHRQSSTDSGIFHNNFDIYDVYSIDSANETEVDYEYGFLNFDIELTNLNDTQTRDDHNSEINSLIAQLKEINSSDSWKALGDIYSFGHYGLTPNVSLGEHYYTLIINSDDLHLTDDDNILAHAHFMLGVFYQSGLLGNHDQNESIGLIHYTLGEKLGSLPSMMTLAHMYQYGLGVEQNFEMSLIYYTKLFNNIENELLTNGKFDDLFIVNQKGNSTKTIKDLINVPNFDKYSFRIGDLINNGLYGLSEVSYVRSSLRSFETYKLYQEFLNSLDDDDNDSKIHFEEKELNEKFLNLYLNVQLYYNGDYLHDRDFSMAKHFAETAIETASNIDLFKDMLNGNKLNSNSNPDWIIHLGKIYLYLSHMYSRGEGTPKDINLALTYQSIARKLTSTKLFIADSLSLNLYHEKGDLNEGLKLLNENSHMTFSQSFHNIFYNHYMKNGDADLSGQDWSQLSYGANYDHTLSLRFMIKSYLDGKYHQGSTEQMVGLLSNYIKFYEPIFFNFKETFMSLINDHKWKSIMGFIIQSELGFEHSQNSLGFLLYPSIGLPKIKVNSINRFLYSLRYFDISGKHNNPDTLNYLGDMYYWGILKEENKNKSNNWLTSWWPMYDYNVKSWMLPNSMIAAESDEDKWVFKPNFIKSMSMYRQSAQLGSHMAHYNIGWLYEFGIGCSQDLHMAKRYYDMALEKPNASELAIKVALWRIWLKIKFWWLIGGNIGEEENLKAKISMNLFSKLIKIWNLSFGQ